MKIENMKDSLVKCKTPDSAVAERVVELAKLCNLEKIPNLNSKQELLISVLQLECHKKLLQSEIVLGCVYFLNSTATQSKTIIDEALDIIKNNTLTEDAALKMDRDALEKPLDILATAYGIIIAAHVKFNMKTNYTEFPEFLIRIINYYRTLQ